MIRRTLTTLLVLAGVLTLAAPASAHRSPGNCNANKFEADLSRDNFTVKNGDIINYTVTVNNLTDGGQIACDVSAITVRLQFPAANGKPGPVYQTVVANASYAAEQKTLSFGPFPYTVAADPGVTELTARISVEN